MNQVNSQLAQLKQDHPGLRSMIEGLEASERTFLILHPSENLDPSARDVNSFRPEDSNDLGNGVPVGGAIFFDPTKSETVSGDVRNPRVGLAHELSHAEDADQGTAKYVRSSDGRYEPVTTDNGIPVNEVKAINTENRARAKTGDPRRTSYGGKPVPADLLDED